VPRSDTCPDVGSGARPWPPPLLHRRAPPGLPTYPSRTRRYQRSGGCGPPISEPNHTNFYGLMSSVRAPGIEPGWDAYKASWLDQSHAQIMLVEAPRPIASETSGSETYLPSRPTAVKPALLQTSLGPHGVMIHRGPMKGPNPKPQAGPHAGPQKRRRHIIAPPTRSLPRHLG
jgi:hypothetical protein